MDTFKGLSNIEAFVLVGTSIVKEGTIEEGTFAIVVDTSITIEVDTFAIRVDTSITTEVDTSAIEVGTFVIKGSTRVAIAILIQR